MLLIPDRVASMLETIGQDTFGQALLEVFDPGFEVIHCAAYVRPLDKPAPKVVVAAAHSQDANARARQLATLWSGGDFTIDPLFAELEGLATEREQLHFLDVRSAPGCTGVRARMVERYYDGQGLGAEACFTVRSHDRVTSLSLFRPQGRGGFSPAQRAQLAAMTGMMLKSARRHAVLSMDEPASSPASMPRSEAAAENDWTQSRAERFARLRSALLVDKGRLTLREAEICAYIVLGHTVLGISLMLDISINTVATHRKRAYAKLGISSQTELFNVCLKFCT